jgi:hypothetical protein
MLGLKGLAVLSRKNKSAYAARAARVHKMQQATRKAQNAASAARAAAQNAAAAAAAATAAAAPGVAAAMRKAAATARKAAKTAAMQEEVARRQSRRLAGMAAEAVNNTAARTGTRKVKSVAKPKNATESAIEAAVKRGILSAPTFAPPGSLGASLRGRAKKAKAKTARRSPHRANAPRGNTFNLTNVLKALGPK